MAPKPSGKRHSPSQDSEGMFHGMSVFLLPQGVQPRRLQVWKKKLLQMGAKIEENLSERVTHIFAVDFSTLKQMIHEKLNIPKISLLKYQWLEDCLKSGERLSENPYVLKSDSKGRAMSGQFLGMVVPNLVEARSHSEGLSPSKRSGVDAQGSKAAEGTGNTEDNMREASYTKDKHTYAGGKIPEDERKLSQCSLGGASHSISPSYDASQEPKELDSLYSPPDLNKDVTEIFGKLVNIYRALGDERRSFSYYKAIIVIEKLPFKIQNAEQVKHLPAIGKSMQDHIKEIVTTGKLSKLEHFEKDEKVQTVTLFGEVWGVGPSTALKLYEKGHRTLDDLKHDDSLTKSQKYGLKFFYDIKKKIPRHEVKEMEMLLQDVGEEILPGVVIVCGGSYRRGKASCGDLDIIITHSDGESLSFFAVTRVFLLKYIQRLKDINFLREDLVLSIHSIEGTDSGIDTYFGFCTYPGREQRHRIDLKVYPRNRYAFGLIAWTGNDVLNRRLRLLAESEGYRLDDTGLYLAAHGTSGKRGMKSSTSLSCNTEKEVFDVLGFPWLEPHQRNL